MLWGKRVDVARLGELLGLLLPVGDERPVDEDAVDHPELRGARGAEGEADGPAALLDVGLAHEVLRRRVLRVVDAGDAVALVDPALVGGVTGHGAVPVEVVGGQVEHGPGVGAQRGRPVELVAGELDGEDVVRLVAEHRVQQGDPDVADGGRAQAWLASRIEASIRTVVVLPLVPVTASQGAGSRPSCPLSRQASSTSPQTGTPASAAAVKSGLPGFQPGAVTTSSVDPGRVSPSPRRTVIPSASSSAAWARERSSSPSLTTVTSAPRSCRARAAGIPLTPRPATVTCLPCQSTLLTSWLPIPRRRGRVRRSRTCPG